jgi:hypothetical protein
VKTIKFIFSVLVALFIGTAVQASTGLNAFAVAGTVLGSGAILPYVVKDLPKGMAFMAVSPATDISALQGYITKYDKTLIYQMLNGLDFVKDLAIIRNLREPRALPKMTVDEGVRRLNLDIEQAKGGRSWTERIITPQLGMKIIKMIPEEVRESFMSEMLDPNAKELPFAQWVWAREFEKIASELNDNFYLNTRPTVVPFDAAATYAVGAHVLYKEVIYKQVSAGTTTAGESPESASAKWEDVDNKVLFEGPDAVIKKAISTEGLLAVGTGTFDEGDAYAYFKEMWGAVTEAHKNKGMVAHVSYDVQQDLAENINTLFGSGKGIGGVDIEEGNSFIMKNTGGRLRIVPHTWMGSSRRVIMTHPGNAVLGLNAASDSQKVGKVVETLHGYRAIVKFILAFQFRDLENLYVNDQA